MLFCGENFCFSEEFFWKSQSALSAVIALSAVCRILKNSSAVFFLFPSSCNAVVGWFALLFA
jgi:hypothetical protein